MNCTNRQCEILSTKVKDLLSRIGDRLTPVCLECGAEAGTLHFIKCPDRASGLHVSDVIPFGVPGAGSDSYHNIVALLIFELREITGVPIPALPKDANE